MCMRHRPLDKNQVCRDCNDESGLRQCHGPCGEILPLFLKFEDKRMICRDCWARLRRVRRLGGRG
jgi:ribosomal protein L40E